MRKKKVFNFFISIVAYNWKRANAMFIIMWGYLDYWRSYRTSKIITFKKKIRSVIISNSCSPFNTQNKKTMSKQTTNCILNVCRNSKLTGWIMIQTFCITTLVFVIFSTFFFFTTSMEIAIILYTKYDGVVQFLSLIIYLEIDSYLTGILA